MSEDEKSFWKTLPGIITGIAAIITAVTGLLVALNSAGLFSRSSGADKAPAEIKKEAKKDADGLSINKETPVKEIDPKKTDQQYKAVLSMTQIKTTDHEYKILGTSVEPATTTSRTLKISIRYKNNSDYSPANFWNEGFRLAIDSALTAPVGELNELVDRHAELVGTVTFEIPNDAKDFVFHILDPSKDIAIPLKISSN